MNKTRSEISSPTSASEKRTAFFQPKITINQPHDVYGQEADATGEKIMTIKETSSDIPAFFSPALIPIQRKCSGCEEEEKQINRKEAAPGNTSFTSSAESYMSSLNNGGRSLSAGERNFFEPKFNYDFSQVRVHFNTEANESAASINAHAYTQGNNIVFAKDQYHPGTEAGKKLMAHELTHVIQQKDINGFSDSGTPAVQRASDDPAPISFEVSTATTTKKNILETLRDEGSSFSFGWVNDPAIFSMESEIIAHDESNQQAGNWVVGMLQLMKDYKLNISWGEGPSNKSCGDSFPNENIRDVKNSLGGSPWFDPLTTSEPFAGTGDKKGARLADSPGALNVPYQTPVEGQQENFGSFDFGCSFVTYVSAFNYNQPELPGAWKHLKSVQWQTALKGSFDARQEGAKKLVGISGSTSVGTLSNGYPANLPPKLVGLAAIDKVCPISQCWNPKLKCTKVVIP